MTVTATRRLAVGLAVALATAACTAGPPVAAPGSLVPPPSSGRPETSATPSEQLETPAPTAAPTLVPFGALPTATLGAATAAELQAVIEERVAMGAPDMLAAVVTPDGTWAGAAGVGGPDGRDATPTDSFAIASVTKTFTAALILRLVEEGKVDLDAPLASYLGNTVVDTNGATVRDALAMRSGLVEYSPAAASWIAADPSHAWTPVEVIGRFSPPEGPAGSTYIYANSNYLLLALAAEHVTGLSYAAALRSYVLDPVGADRILQQGAGTEPPKPWALPTAAHAAPFAVSDLGAGGAISCISSASFSFGSGSMAADAPSLAAWMWHLFANDIVDASSLETMAPQGSQSHGLGLDRLGGLGRPAFGQTGSKTGYGAIAALFPAEQTVVVVFVNDPEFVVEPAVVALLRAATGS